MLVARTAADMAENMEPALDFLRARVLGSTSGNQILDIYSA